MSAPILSAPIMRAPILRAMVLAAGHGTRMRPLTDTVPKPLIKVAGKALLDYNLDQLAQAGVQEVVVNQHYLGEQIEAHCARIAHPRITLSDERAALLDSGGGIAKMLPFFGQEPFFSLNADTIWLDGPLHNLSRMAHLFDPERMDIMLLLAPTITTIGWGNRGDFFMDPDGRLTRALKGQVAPFAYTGAAILKPGLFVGMPEVFSLNRLFDTAQAQERLYGVRLDGVFLHVGTPQALKEAERVLAIALP